MGQTGQEQASVQYSPTDEEGLRSFEYLPYPNMEQEEDDYVKESEDPPVIITHADVPGKRNSIKIIFHFKSLNYTLNFYRQKIPYFFTPLSQHT